MLLLLQLLCLLYFHGGGEWGADELAVKAAELFFVLYLSFLYCYCCRCVFSEKDLTALSDPLKSHCLHASFLLMENSSFSMHLQLGKAK